MSRPKSFEYTRITPYLYLSSRPKTQQDIIMINELKIDLVISLLSYGNYKNMGNQSFKFVNYPTIDSFLFPIPLFVFKKGVGKAEKVIKKKGKVLVHCKHGVHRSVAMVCCILISQGLTYEQAANLVVQERPLADPYTWYISSRIKQFENYWNKNAKKKQR